MRLQATSLLQQLAFTSRNYCGSESSVQESEVRTSLPWSMVGESVGGSVSG